MTGHPVTYTPEEGDEIAEAVLRLIRLCVVRSPRQPIVRKAPPSFPAYDQLVREGKLSG